jgi:ferredoxin-NADP reductase
MNERNVCVGDLIQFGDELQLEVSLPRQPCYKLNHRFSLKNFAPTTFKTSRTGWYYRVHREGIVAVGDEIRLIKRPNPTWTVERVQEYLHRNTEDLEKNEELASIEELGEESRGMFRNRVAKAKRKAEPNKETWRDFKVVQRKMETPQVVSLMLEAQGVNDYLPKTMLGAHARLKLPNGLIRTYSIVSGDESGVGMANKFELGVALEDNSRGGSQYIHENVKEGDIIPVGRITTDVKPGAMASNHVFIIGGIGVTAFMGFIQKVHQVNYSFAVHYAVRTTAEAAYLDRMESFRDSVVVYDKSKGERMNIPSIIASMPWNSHLYVCGPARMMRATEDAVKQSAMPPEEVHFEAFSADASGDPFEVEIANNDSKVLQVGEEETLLEVLRREVEDIPSSCEVGNCGTCKIGLKSGRVDHRGHALMPEEQENSMLSCVSRGIGRIVVEV